MANVDLLERASVALDQLPQTSDEIADFLLSQNIRGFAYTPESCPIANYLKRELGITNLLVARRNVIFTSDDERYELFLDRWPVVRIFLKRFDVGHYPNLLAQKG